MGVDYATFQQTFAKFYNFELICVWITSKFERIFMSRKMAKSLSIERQNRYLTILRSIWKIILFLPLVTGMTFLLYFLSKGQNDLDNRVLGFALASSDQVSLHSLFPEKQTSRDSTDINTPWRAKNNLFLCKIGLEGKCINRDPADVANRLVSIQIIYSMHQEKMPKLYAYTEFFSSMVKSIGLSSVILESIRDDLDQNFLLTRPNNEPWDIQITNKENFYKRENFLNVVIKKMNENPKVDWEYAMWIDAHQLFENPYWWHETIIKVEKHPSVQLFHELILMNEQNITGSWRPHGFNQWSNIVSDINAGPLKIWGNAWAISKSTYKDIGYIFDKCITGCCDCAYTIAGIEKPPHEVKVNNKLPGKYFDILEPWILETRKVFEGKRASVRGTLLHMEHERSFNYQGETIVLESLIDRFNFTNDIYRKDDNQLVLKNAMLRSIFKVSSMTN